MKNKIIVPRYNDPRWVLLLFFSIYIIYSFYMPNFGRSVWQLVASVLTALIFDALITYKRKKVLFFSLSGFTASLGICFLMFSEHIWPFVVAAFFTVISKQYIKYKNKHIFNPNNFGLIITLLFFSDYVATTTGRWDNGIILPILFIAMGIVITYKVKRLDLAFCHIMFFTVFTFIRYFLNMDQNLMHMFLPMTGPVFYLYTFFHITDPVTTPRTRRGRVVFALIVAFIDAILRHNQVLYSPFYALFIATIIKQLLPNILPIQDSKDIWIYK